MSIHSGYKYSCTSLSRNLIIEVKYVSNTTNRLNIDIYFKENDKFIENINLNLSEFKDAIDGKFEFENFKDLKKYRKNELCISNIHFKNNQIEDDGAYAD